MKISKREIELLKREKYGSKTCEVASGYARNDFSPFVKDLARLEAGEPIDYVIGWREFLGCKIDLSARPLIPREETEFWVGKVLAEEKEVGSRVTRSNFASPLKVLDLFSGSGCIGLAVLKHIPNAKVTFAEKDPKLCLQIKKNLKLNKLKGRVIQSDIFNTLQKSGKFGRFDIIFANPPYIPTQKSKVQKSVKDWEPKEALYAGEDGLAIIKKFLKQAKDHLNVGGKIYLEFGFGQKAKIEKLLKQFGYTHYQFNKDQFGKWRWVVIEL